MIQIFTARNCNVTFRWGSRMGISFVIIIIIEGNDVFDVRPYAICVSSLIVFLFHLVLIILLPFRSFILSLYLHLSVSFIFIK